MKIDSVYYGNCIEVLKYFDRNSVHLVYIDPPFNTNNDQKGYIGDKNEIVYSDTWEGREGYKKVMKPIIEQLYEILKDNGSFYLHCDYHSDGILREMCDKKFGYDKFRNRICWKRFNAKSTGRNKFGVLHDVILFYTKSNNYTFNVQYEKPSDLTGCYCKRDNRGYYRNIPIIMSNKWVEKRLGESRYFPKENKTVKLCDTHGWKWTQERINKFVDSGGEFEWLNGKPEYKKYLDDGIPCSDIWDNLYLHPSSNERLGYPSQKPLSLLERIISTSTEPDKDYIVLDAFCGTGTSLAAAKKLHCHFIGIDNDIRACKISAMRVGIPYTNIIGIIPTLDDLKNKMTWYEFQKFICDSMNAVCRKKTGDSGIDGVTNYKGLPIQIKQSDVGVGVVSRFRNDIKNYGKKIGSIVGFSFSKGAIEEKDKAFNDDHTTIKLYTPQDVLDEKPFKDGFSVKMSLPNLKPIKPEPIKIRQVQKTVI